MNTKTFKTGDIVTPEFLNELQNPSYDKQPGEVGYLPTPDRLHIPLGDYGFAKIEKKDNAISFEIRENKQFDPSVIRYTTESKELYQGHSFDGGVYPATTQEWMKSGSGAVQYHQEFKVNQGGHTEDVLINKTIDDNGDIVPAFGMICIYSVSGGINPDPPKKCEITASGPATYTHDGTRWVQNA